MNSGRKIAARAGVLALVAGGMTVIAVGPAQADTFSPGNTAPTVGTVTLAASITPAADGSAVQNVNVTVGDVDSLLDLNTVRLCMYKTSLTDTACATPNAQNAMTLTWTRSSGLFVLAAGTTTTWTDATSTVTGYTPTGLSMTMNFKFKVGRAALADGWTGKVTATDVSAAATSSSGTTTINYYSSITSRASQAFGDVPPGATGVTINNVSDGSIVANGSSTVTMLQAAGFTDGTTTAGIADGVAGSAVSATNVALDCGSAATYNVVGAIRLATSPATLETPVLTTGTVEAGTTSLVNSCKLVSGGQLPVHPYTATVTTGIGAS